jgi:hypothetical protein
MFIATPCACKLLNTLARLWIFSFTPITVTRSFPGLKRPGRGADHPPQRRGRECVELYLYSPSRPLVACYRATFTFASVTCCYTCREVLHCHKLRLKQALIADLTRRLDKHEIVLAQNIFSVNYTSGMAHR